MHLEPPSPSPTRYLNKVYQFYVGQATEPGILLPRSKRGVKRLDNNVTAFMGCFIGHFN